MYRDTTIEYKSQNRPKYTDLPQIQNTNQNIIKNRKDDSGCYKFALHLYTTDIQLDICKAPQVRKYENAG